MQRNALFLLALAKGIFSFDAGTAATLAPLADRVLAGESLELLAEHGLVQGTQVDEAVRKSIHAATPAPTAAAGGGAQVFRYGWHSDLDSLAPGSIAIISVQGIILKNAMCGIGSMDRADRIRTAGAHRNVAAILLDIDTPGGQVSGLNSVHDAILEVRAAGKPVIALINDGYCYSAGYHTASACTEIWATHTTSGVGSIGTMCQFIDTTEADKKQGIKRVAVYATDSTEKNQTFQKALAGDVAALVAELDTLNKDFQARILAQRAAKIKDTALVFKGQTMSAAEGIKLGLVDSIGSMQAALNRCTELARLGTGAAPAPAPEGGLFDGDDDEDDDEMTSTNPNQSDDPNMKQFPLLAAALGLASAKDFNTNAEGAHLQPAHLDALEARLATAAGLQSQLDTATTARATAEQSLATAQAQATKDAGRIADLSARLLDAPAGTDAKHDGQEKPAEGSEETPEANAWDTLDAMIAKEAKGF
jgi:ClpP class serine protease